MDHLANLPHDPAERDAYRQRLGFIKPTADEKAVGFDLRSGLVLDSWKAINIGTWEQPEALAADEDLAALRTLHERAVKEWRGMAETLAEVASDDDPSLNDDGRLKIAAKIIQPKIDAVAEAAKRELERADTSISAEEAAVAAALKPTDPAVAALHSDIRAHWKAACDESRAKGNGTPMELTLAILQGTVDDDTLAAIATAPPYMTGMSADLHAKARALLAARVAPERVARINALRTGKQRALMALTALDNSANALLDFKRARDLLERETKRAKA